MLDISTLTKALETLLSDNSTTGQFTIERSQRINSDPGRMPWLGIYPGTATTAPHVLGRSNQAWLENVELQIVCQTNDYNDDGAAASDALEVLLKYVMDAVNANLTLGVNGARVVGARREYRYNVTDDDGSGSLFLPWAIITLTLEVRGVS